MGAERSSYRCAVYTRKSSEEGLEQDFNSLHAQREACEAFIVSQRGEGWRLIATAYNDGGLSGGNMERPALKRLLSDIAAGMVDVIVVYKVDRLTRSLSDFAKMVEVFDKQGVSFVAVTQQFNTTTSMGRLTLNVLLSFAQFEREVTGERIRDKIAASKKKGMWMGGPTPLGYRIVEKKLLVEPEEAERVREIFRRYLQCSGVNHLVRKLKAAGIQSKQRADKPSTTLVRGALYKILSNPIYIGQIRHKGQCHPGQHEGILDETLWTAVQEKLKASAARGGISNRVTTAGVLIGKLFDASGRMMIANHANKKGRRYRYYVSPTDASNDSDPQKIWRLSGPEIEQRVETMVRAMLGDRTAIVRAGLDAKILEGKIGKLLSVAAEPCEWVTRVERVQLGSEIQIALVIPFDPPVRLEKSFQVQMKRRGVETRIVIPGQDAAGPVDSTLFNAIGRSLRWWDALKTGAMKSAQDIANQEGLREQYVQRHLPLAMLAPDIIQAISEGKQPVDLTAQVLLLRTTLPADWGEQRRLLGFG